MLRLILLSTILFWLTGPIIGQTRSQRSEKLYEQALQQYRKRNYEGAIMQVNESIRLSPSAQAYLLSGYIHEAQKKDLRAVSDYEAALMINPGLTEARFQKALVYLNYGNPQQAYLDFTDLIDYEGVLETRSVYFEIDPLSTQQHKVMTLATMKSRMYHYRGQASEKLQHYEQALSDYNLAIQLDTTTDYFISRGLLNHKMGDDLGAIRDLKYATVLDPQSELAWYNLALINPGAKVPEQLLSKEGFSPLLSLLASRAMEDENYMLAKKYFDISIAKDGKDALAYINRGRSLLKMDQYAAARRDFQKARSLAHAKFEALYLIGNSYFMEKKHSDALAYYNQYLAVDPTNGMVWYNAAMCHLELDQDEEACHCLSQAHSLGMVQAQSVQEKYCQ